MKTLLDAKTFPTGLRRGDAAMHCGISASFFDELVSNKLLPPPRRLGIKVKIWLRQELDQALLALPSDQEEDTLSNPCDRLLE